MEPAEVDYASLLDRRAALPVYGEGVTIDDGAYADWRGFQLRRDGHQHGFVQDIVRLSDDAFLLAGSGPSLLPIAARHRQLITDGDWVHIQLRIDGAAREEVAPGETLEVPARACVVTRYSSGSRIERFADEARPWKVACLWVRPAAAGALLDVSPATLPPACRWLTDPGSLGLRHQVLPLDFGMSLAVQDMLTCHVRGGSRRAFMYAKSLEILSVVMHHLARADEPAAAAAPRLSARDIERLAAASAYMSAHLDAPASLDWLARSVGLNRTKLATGFKQAYGVSVQEYWRDLRLDAARRLLMEPGARVTDVAYRVGYVELSSFTRAFRRRFGALPRHCRSHTA